MKKILAFAILSFIMLQEGRSETNFVKGYRGYVDAGYSIGCGDYGFGRIEINTSHGYQFCPYFFLGAGLGLHYMSSYETDGMEIPLDQRESKVDIPVFANVRCIFTKKKIAPFVDLKTGAFLTNNGDLYVNASVGCRFALNSKQAVNVSVGYATEKLEFEMFSKFTDYPKYTTNPTKRDTELITLKLGFEF